MAISFTTIEGNRTSKLILDEINSNFGLINTTNVPNADEATHATSADTATSATSATHATSADTATTATSATTATTATNATKLNNLDAASYVPCASTLVTSISSLASLGVGRYFCVQAKQDWEPLPTSSTSNQRTFILEVSLDSTLNLNNYYLKYISGEGSGAIYNSYYEIEGQSNVLKWKSVGLSIATSSTLGGVQPVSKTSDMTQNVGVDSTGKLYTAPSTYSLPVATSSTLGGVKPVSKTSDMTQSVGVDSNGLLYTTAGGSALTTPTFSYDSYGEEYSCNLSYSTIAEKVGNQSLINARYYDSDLDICQYLTLAETEYNDFDQHPISFTGFVMNTDKLMIQKITIKQEYDEETEEYTDVISRTIKYIGYTYLA